MAQHYLMLLWHMHQPFYKDLVEGSYEMPWVRLHALKDYYGMVAILREFPDVHVTFNLVPSLVAQIEDYASGRARERNQETVFKPAEELSRQEKLLLLTEGLQVNRENVLNRYARLRELYDRLQATSPESAARLFATQDLRDLQVLSQLAWFDEIYLASDSAVSGLASKGRNYTEQDKAQLYNKEMEIINKVLEEYRAAAGRGQIEVSTSPFYHPIMPLLCDSSVGAESHPGLRLPLRRFRYPEDVRAQLEAAIELHEKVFGQRPCGLWPSEGSLSDEVLRIAAEEGFQWAATDEGVLSRTLQVSFYRQADGTVAGGHELYRSHRFPTGSGGIHIFFRDHQISDLIGFVYARMDPEAAAADLHRRISAAARSAGDRPAVVSVILDGENAWESYRGNGREFLKAFYRRLTEDPSLRAVTGGEALKVTEPGLLEHVVPGSWINANFDVWMGADEDNRAWDLLEQARRFFEERSAKAGLPAEDVKLARQELWVAEGSDWCWWYGPEHSSSQDAEFDLLFRKHLSNVYHILGSSPPDELALPIKRLRSSDRWVPPSAKVSPVIDGKITSYFEWLGAGSYSPDSRSSSMHAAISPIQALYLGATDAAVYLRLDLTERFLEAHSEFEIRVSIDIGKGIRLRAPVSQGHLGQVRLWRGENELGLDETRGRSEAAFASVFEIRLDYALIEAAANTEIRLRASLWSHDLPIQVLPPEGWLALMPVDAAADWS